MNALKKLAALALCALFATAFTIPAEAQQTHKIPRIGYLSARSPDREQRTQTAFEQGLLELGYRVGKNIVIEYRYSPNYEKLRDRLPS